MSSVFVFFGWVERPVHHPALPPRTRFIFFFDERRSCLTNPKPRKRNGKETPERKKRLRRKSLLLKSNAVGREWSHTRREQERLGEKEKLTLDIIGRASAMVEENVEKQEKP